MRVYNSFECNRECPKLPVKDGTVGLPSLMRYGRQAGTGGNILRLIFHQIAFFLMPENGHPDLFCSCRHENSRQAINPKFSRSLLKRLSSLIDLEAF